MQTIKNFLFNQLTFIKRWMARRIISVCRSRGVLRALRYGNSVPLTSIVSFSSIFMVVNYCFFSNSYDLLDCLFQILHNDPCYRVSSYLEQSSFYNTMHRIYTLRSVVNLEEMAGHLEIEDWRAGRDKGLEDPFLNHYKDPHQPTVNSNELEMAIDQDGARKVLEGVMPRLPGEIGEKIISEAVLSNEEAATRFSNAKRNEDYRMGYLYGACRSRADNNLIVDTSVEALLRSCIAPFPEREEGKEIVYSILGLKK